MDISENFIPSDVKYADLHMHTSRSDGTKSPKEIIDLAASNQIGIISVTDHDTLSGVYEASIEAKKLGIGYISGVEISAKSPSGVLHILGYGIDIENEGLLKDLEEYQYHRNQRNQKIIDQLNGFGIAITYEDVVAKAGNSESIGRPHIAAVLQEKGTVRDFDTAFSEYLGRWGSAYIEKEFFTPKEAIQIIHKAGGLAVIAHPTSLRMNTQDLNKFLKNLEVDGLDGIEVSSTSHTDNVTRKLNRICDELDLLRTAGSDYHGTNKPQVLIGRNQGGKKIQAAWISPEILELAQ